MSRAARKREGVLPDPVPDYFAEVESHLRYLLQFAMMSPGRKSAEVVAKMEDIIAAVGELRAMW